MAELVPLREARTPACGGKARGLCRLLELGLPVPEGFVLTGLRAGDDLVALLGDRVREGRWAVRSSALSEDGAGRSFAGQYLTRLDRGGTADVVAAVWECVASGEGERVGAYAAAQAAGADTEVAVVVQRMVPAALAGVHALQADHSVVDVFRYIGANLVFLNFLEPNLPGLFDGQRFTEVNGALWTLKIEVMFYLALPMIAWGLARLGKHWWVGIAVLIVSAFAWIELMLAFDHALSPVLARQLPGQMMYFAAGIALWKIWPVAQAQATWFGVIGGVALMLSLLVPGLEALRVLGLAGLVAGLAFGPGPAMNVASYGDVSYGIYIVHFPIVQLLVSVGAFAALGIWGGLVLSAILVFLTSYALWWWVEKPALRRDSHYKIISTRKVLSCASMKPSR